MNLRLRRLIDGLFLRFLARSPARDEDGVGANPVTLIILIDSFCCYNEYDYLRL